MALKPSPPPRPSFLHLYLPTIASFIPLYLASAAILFKVKYVFVTHCECPGPPGNILGFPAGCGHFLGIRLTISCLK